MNAFHSKGSRTARGFVLIASLLLLLVMTLLALAMFRSFGVQELVAGNVREKQRSLQSAFAAEQYAEEWLASPGNAQSSVMTCTTLGLTAYSATSNPYICATPISLTINAAMVPWLNTNGVETGWTFFPGANTGTGDMFISTTGGLNGSNQASYYQIPRLYIGLLSTTASQNVFRIDAWNWGGTTNTASVIEATYTVISSAGNATLP